MALSRLLRPVASSLLGAGRISLAPRAMTLSTSGCLHAPSVELLCDAKAYLGGGPFYERGSNQLLWVDKKGRSINFLDVETGKNQAIKMGDGIGAVIPIYKSNNLVVLMGMRIVVVNRDSGAIVRDLANLESLEAADIRINTARCDRLGRMWCGTGPTRGPYRSPDKMGSLYSFGAVIGRLMRHPTEISIINGMDWNKNFTRMFCVNSLHKKIYSFDYNESSAEISRQELLVDYNSNGTRGHPAGMCKDRDGNLWVAGYMGGNVTCWDPDTGKALAQVDVPVKEVTSCCFGGPSYDWLFITTARMNSDEKELEEFPQSGGVFVAKDVGTGGERGYKARLEPIKLTL